MRLVLVGARHDGQAHLVLDLLAEGQSHDVVALLDENPALWGTRVHGLPVLGPPAELARAIALGAEGGVVAVGSPEARSRLGALIASAGLTLPSLVHPRAYVASSATLGKGVFVGALATVSAGAVVEDLALISPSAVLSHHVRVGRGAAVAPGAVLGGRCRLGAGAFVGLGALVLPERSVGDNAVLGAGCLVNRDIPAGAHVVGVPAREIRV